MIIQFLKKMSVYYILKLIHDLYVVSQVAMIPALEFLKKISIYVLGFLSGFPLSPPGGSYKK